MRPALRVLALMTAALALSGGLAACAGPDGGPTTAPASSTAAPEAAARESIAAQATAESRPPAATLPAALFEDGPSGTTFAAWAPTTSRWREAGPVLAESVAPASQATVAEPGELTVPAAGPGVVHRIVLLCERTSTAPEPESSGVDIRVSPQDTRMIAMSPGCAPLDVRHTVAADEIVDGAVHYLFGAPAGQSSRLAILQS